MYLKAISLLIILLVEDTVLEENVENQYVVVSTTQRSSRQQLDDQLAKFENKLTNTSHWFETQIQQMQKSLEEIKLTNRQLLEKINQKDQFLSRPSLPRSCQEIKNRKENVSQSYFIKPEFSPKVFIVYCDMETRGGGWTYIINRFDGSQSFDLKWKDYKNGFGNPAKELWLGLEYLHQLTASEENQLLIEMVDWNGAKTFAHYTGFSIGSETEGYPIKVLEGYSGDAEDRFSELFGMKFSTNDNDQDMVNANCAADAWGGWWYKMCAYYGKFTGVYGQGKRSKGIVWGKSEIKGAKMMVKPRKF